MGFEFKGRKGIYWEDLEEGEKTQIQEDFRIRRLLKNWPYELKGLIWFLKNGLYKLSKRKKF